jgi:hypothetical protein
MKTTTEATGTHRTTIVTKTVYKSVKRIMIQYVDRTCEVAFYKNDMITLCKSF